MSSSIHIVISSLSNIRIVHDPAPADNSAADLHIWKPVQVSKPAGIFTTPHAISDALCAFLGLPSGSKVSRSDVARGVISYVKTRGLISGHKIAQDDPLRDLLGPAPDLGILNLQRYLSPHYLFEDELGFEAWWTARESPLWVGVNAEDFSAHTFNILYKTLARYPSVTFVCYTGIHTSDSEAPCGCYGRDGTCEYHREKESETAVCGCSVDYKIVCEYHK